MTGSTQSASLNSWSVLPVLGWLRWKRWPVPQWRPRLYAVAAPLVPELGRHQARLKAFSYVFDERKSCDEREYIAPVVDALELDATFMLCDDAWTLRDLETWSVEHDVIWRNVFAPLPMRLHDAAERAGCRVILDGQFGDGLCVRKQPLLRRTVSGLFGVQDRAMRPLLGRLIGRLRQIRRAVRGDLYAHPGLHPKLKRLVRETPPHTSDVPLGRIVDPSWALSRSEVSKAGHRRGLRVESPYYDRDLVEFMAALPSNQLHRPDRNRYIQRNAMLVKLPRSNSERMGKTWVTPLMEMGLLDGERESFLKILRRERAVQAGYIDGDWLRAAVCDDGALRENLGHW